MANAITDNTNLKNFVYPRMTCGLAEGQRFMLATHLHVVTGVRYDVVSIPPCVIHVLGTFF